MTTPAEIVRAVFVQQGLVILPGGPPQDTIPYVQQPYDGSLVCYVSSMPDDDDQAACIYDTAGLWFGRTMRSGKTLIFPGFKIMVRALDAQLGFALAQALANAMDAFRASAVLVNGETHYVQALNRVSPIVSLGEAVGRKSMLYTLNGRLSPQDSEPPLG